MHIIFVLLYFISISSSSIVKWVPNRSFSLRINFDNGKLPCSKQTVVFPETVQEAVQIENDTYISGFILPVEGDIFIGDGTIVFGPDPEDQQCTDEGNSYYNDNSIASWSQPDVWSSDKFNEATPDAERIPCSDDTVVFDDNAQFTLFLPNRLQYLKEMKIGDQSLDEELLINRIFHAPNPSQIFLLNSESDFINLKFQNNKCKIKSGCPCQIYSLKIDCEMKYCHKPNCVDPVKPIGHCCEICGGNIVLDVDQSFNMMSFKEYVDKFVDSYSSDKIAYHIGVLPHETSYSHDGNETWSYHTGDKFVSKQVQVVVVEKGEYTGASAQVINDIYYYLNVEGKKQLFLSGSSLERANLGWKIFISMFFVVVLAMGAIYAYYYKLPGQWTPNVSLDLLRLGRPTISRFQRTDSVVTLTRRDSTVSAMSGGTAFRNPLYDSKRERVQVTAPVETVEEE